MSKKVIYIATFLFYLFYLRIGNAQTINTRNDSGIYISIGGGSCIPLGQFKSNSYPGMSVSALNGYGGSIQIEHPLKPGWFGLVFESGYYTNPYNLSGFENLISSDIRPYTISGGSSNYKENSFLAGIFFETTFKKFVIKFKSKIGLDFVSLPYVNYYLNPNLGTTWPILPQPFFEFGREGSYDNLVYSIEILIQYPLNRHISIRGNTGYLSNFSQSPNSTSQAFGLWEIPLSQLHLELGLSYHL